MKKKNLIIIGSGGHSRVAIDIALELNHSILGIIDINFKQKIKEKACLGPALGPKQY